MEDKIKKQRIKQFVFTIIGYLVGVSLYDILGNESSPFRHIFGVILVVILRSLFDLYQYKKHPKLKEKEKQLEKDERLIFIRDRAAFITNNIVFAILIILWFVFVIRGNDELAYYLSGFIIFIFAIMQLVKYYLNKRM